MKAQTTIDKEIQRLGKIARSEEDLLAARIAWEVLHAIRWAREDVKGWPSPTTSVKGATNLIRAEIQEGKITGRLPV